MIRDAPMLVMSEAKNLFPPLKTGSARNLIIHHCTHCNKVLIVLVTGFEKE